MGLRPQARNPLGIHIRELFVTPPEQVRGWYPEPPPSWWGYAFRALDRVLHWVHPYMPKGLRARAVEKAVAFVDERLNGLDGLGAIFPAMVNAVEMYDVLGVPADDPRVVQARAAIRALVVEEAECAWVQPCVSPVWDTALAAHALLEAGDPLSLESCRRAADWLVDRQITDVVGDWAARRPGLSPGGWAFQYANDHYPDVDDTAVVMAALDRLDPVAYAEPIRKGRDWLRGMQSKGGGWGAFDAENTAHYLNHIPFADHGALLDPPTADVTARCLGMLAQLGFDREHPAVASAIAYLRNQQEEDGSWFGRWGTNYVYGTWSALAALNAAGIAHDHPAMRKGVAWLLSRQRIDGGWGEDGRSYWDNQPRGGADLSTPSQTAWALLGLMAAGEVANPAVARGVEYLIRTRTADGLWDEEHFTAVGFPRVFYLRYHGYRAFFPVWALARFRNLMLGNSGLVMHAL
jgi:squalene-hopene/tetraprenyl-beta-curcumene cyclase